ncbi:uncharacterized protein [Dendropsophus ebraccatus]|uniref:uncharacterized protein n=1 Tax=Dendropsophus ebraccatus TaxID=150705 RepID=UPI00383120F0
MGKPKPGSEEKMKTPTGGSETCKQWEIQTEPDSEGIWQCDPLLAQEPKSIKPATSESLFRIFFCKKTLELTKYKPYGVPRNKIVPYMDKHSSALTSKEDFDLNKKKDEKDFPEKRFQWTPNMETSEEKHTEKCSTSTSYLDELEKHLFSVCCPNGIVQCLSGKMAKHATFVIWAVFSELDLGQWRSHDFWSIMFMMALMWFIRLYLHYCAQWLFLQAISIPVFTFAFHPHTVELTYQHSLMHTREELFMVVVGPMSLNVSMLLIILLRWSCQILFRSFPTILSKFIVALGLWTVLDPLAVFIVDSFLGRLSYSVEKPIADAAKLYWFFIRIEQSGTPGILITLLIYTMIFIISSSVLYLYLLRIHKESWILDVFQRVACEEGVCHVPYDLEISHQELSHIVRKAEQWRGINGDRRKVTIAALENQDIFDNLKFYLTKIFKLNLKMNVTFEFNKIACIEDQDLKDNTHAGSKEDCAVDKLLEPLFAIHIITC